MPAIQLRPTTPITKPRRLVQRGVKALPVPGYTSRWNPSCLTLADGAGAYRLPDLVGTTHLNTVLVTDPPILGTEAGGQRFVENTTARRMTTAVDTMALAAFTLVVVAKITAVPTGTGLIAGSVAPTANLGVHAGAFYGSAGATLAGMAYNAGLHVFIFTATGTASSVLTIDGTEWTGNAGTNQLTELLLFGGDSANVARGRIYDAALYPTALTPTQRAILAGHLLSENTF